jgi:hypothetical protein
MEYNENVSDYIESAAIVGKESLYAGSCTAPCRSCGGGCYGCKGSKAAEVPSEEKRTYSSSKLISIVLNED